MKEIWKDIPNFEGYYQASNLGNIRSVDRISKGRWSDNYFYKGKTLLPKKTRLGYLHVVLVKGYGKRYNKSVHRLVASTFIENVDEKPQINHIDGNKLNNNISNLEWVTPSENIRHGYSNGLHLKGESHGMAKYSNKIINNIVELWKTGKYTKSEIGRILNVSTTHTHRIINTNKRS